MAPRPDYGQALATAFRLPDAPRLVTRSLHKSTMSLTELQGPPDHGMTSAVPYDEAFLVQLRLRDCPRCEYFSEGRHLEGVDRRAGVIQIHDLRRDPRVNLKDPFHIIHLHLPLKVLNGVAEEVGASPVDDLLVHPGKCLRDPTLEHLLQAIRPLLARPEEASAVFVDHVACAISAYVAQTYGGVRTVRRPPRGGLAPWQERLSKELLDADLSGNMPLRFLALQCGLSVRHFTRAFRQSTGVPPHRYLLKRRVERATQLLKDPALSLSDIALACGFADQSHFTRVFSASMSMSPGAWRRTHVSKATA
ncbi:helix-turn-helix transcriptional regulator [Pyxidicoccus parkwayensis]|uniref:Helix-turn-helix transcriptional regulator n=1 Tax=Pyxidicoccus parkwayensis TaxID=2813578 RepID=A0ABX7NZI9_9BACT|nr:AraC family transcriptional regulator [Pyxidicoccus parkwaysis]QSQ22816.1 helix-turn-helix transcriptional regulator [Pyxidicoccus parkwaysis]